MIWDKLSPFYDAIETIYNGKCFKGIAKEIIKYVREDDTVLECACGTGLLTEPMAKKCKQVVATDYSKGMLKQTAKKVAKYNNVRVESASIMMLPYGNDEFDVVVAANVIHLVDDPEKALSEMKRVCKPGGKMVITNYINESKKNSLVAAKVLELMGVDFKRQFSLESYQEFLTSFGIEVGVYSVIDGRMPCAFAIIENK